MQNARTIWLEEYSYTSPLITVHNKEPCSLVICYLLAQRCDWSNNLQETQLKVKKEKKKKVYIYQPQKTNKEKQMNEFRVKKRKLGQYINYTAT